jgi:hypothetical protein
MAARSIASTEEKSGKAGLIGGVVQFLYLSTNKVSTLLRLRNIIQNQFYSLLLRLLLMQILVKHLS